MKGAISEQTKAWKIAIASHISNKKKLFNTTYPDADVEELHGGLNVAELGLDSYNRIWVHN